MEGSDIYAIELLKGSLLFQVYRIGLDIYYKLIKGDLAEFTKKGTTQLKFMAVTSVSSLGFSHDDSKFLSSFLMRVISRFDKRIIKIIEDHEAIKSGVKITDLTDNQVVEILRSFDELPALPDEEVEG